jgi:hypothetical protein
LDQQYNRATTEAFNTSNVWNTARCLCKLTKTILKNKF